MAKGGRKPKSSTEAKSETAEKLLAAFKFLEPAAVLESDQANQTHCNIRGTQCTMFDGLKAFGIILPYALPNCNPHLLQLISAIKRCHEIEPIISIEGNFLKIKAGRFTAHVPCLPDDLFAPVIPATAIAPLNDAFKTSLEIVGVIAKENASRQIETTVYARNGSAVATDGTIIFEHWHGNNVPDMAFPKTSVLALCKIPKKLTSFGITWQDQIVNSVTFWFEDNSWFRTQLWIEPWPALNKPLEVTATLWPVPAGLWEALTAIEDFTDDYDRAYLRLKTVSTHELLTMGATIEIEGSLPEKIIVTRWKLALFATVATQVDWHTEQDTIKFTGDNFRGVLVKVSMPDASNATS